VKDDEKAIAELAAVSSSGAVRTLHHYLYLPSNAVAATISAKLRQRGFRTEERLGAEGTDWLVLAHHEVVPSVEHIASVRRDMEALVEEVDGEYDGWEADVPGGRAP